MAITLEQAKLNTQDDYDATVIDEFRKSSVILDNLIFDTAVNPAGGGATLTYSYRRVATQRSAQFRELNTECKPASATTTKHSVDLKVLGGSTEYKSPAPHGPGDFFLFVGELAPRAAFTLRCSSSSSSTSSSSPRGQPDDQLHTENGPQYDLGKRRGPCETV